MSHSTRYVVVAIVLLGMSLVGARLAHANMVTNGSFENGPTLPPEQRMQLAVGSTALTGWQVTHAPIDIVSDAYWEAAQGTRSLALNPTGNPGGLAQTIATQPGARYEVSFKLSGEPFTTPALKQLRVSAVGTHADFEYDSTNNWHWDMRYTLFTWSFVAYTTSATIEFLSLTAGPASPVLDEVTVTQSPTDSPDELEGRTFALFSQNPARGAANFEFALPIAERAVLDIVDVQGRRVAVLADRDFTAGKHSLTWNAQGASASIYFVTLRAHGQKITRRFALLR